MMTGASLNAKIVYLVPVTGYYVLYATTHAINQGGNFQLIVSEGVSDAKNSKAKGNKKDDPKADPKKTGPKKADSKKTEPKADAAKAAFLNQSIDAHWQDPGANHSPWALVCRPMATSNSLNSGTSMAARVKPNAPPVTRNGISGSVDSASPGLPMRTLVTV